MKKAKKISTKWEKNEATFNYSYWRFKIPNKNFVHIHKIFWYTSVLTDLALNRYKLSMALLW